MNNKETNDQDWCESEYQDSCYSPIALREIILLIRSSKTCSHCEKSSPVYCLAHRGFDLVTEENHGVERIMSVVEAPEDLDPFIEKIPNLGWSSNPQELGRSLLANYCLHCGEVFCEQKMIGILDPFSSHFVEVDGWPWMIDLPISLLGDEIVGLEAVSMSSEEKTAKKSTWKDFEKSEILKKEQAIKLERESEMNKKEKKIESLKQKKSQLDARIKLLEAAENVRERKKETRRKILVGSYYLEEARKSGQEAALLEKMDKYLTRKTDRSVFDLPPKE